MYRGKQLALAVAVAGLIGAGLSAVSLAQTDAAPANPQGPRILVLVPHGGALTATEADDEDDATSQAPGAQDPSALPGEDEDATPNDPDAATPGAGHPRILILVPVPQGAQVAPDDSQASPDEDDNGDEGSDDDATSGRTLILVPHAPQALPPGIVSA